jgi:hypothetical protein
VVTGGTDDLKGLNLFELNTVGDGDVKWLFELNIEFGDPVDVKGLT